MAEAQLYPQPKPTQQPATTQLLLLNDLRLSPVSTAPANQQKRKRAERSQTETPRKRVRFIQPQPVPTQQQQQLESDLLSELIANSLLSSSQPTLESVGSDPTPTPAPTQPTDLLDLSDIIGLHYATYFQPRLQPLADSALRSSLHLSMLTSATKVALGFELRTSAAVYSALERATRQLESTFLNT
jgi:hypothetical protein